MHYIERYDPLDCSHRIPSLVYVDGGFLKINQTKVMATVGSLDSCRYSPVQLSEKNDLTLEELKWSKNFTTSLPLPKDVEHLYVECFLKHVLVGQTYKSRIFEKAVVENRCETNYKRHIKENSPSETLSILFVGMDGMSKQNLVRTMPKTRDYILNHFKGRELNKFNKVGDNTFHNVIVLLSGNSHEVLHKVNSWNEEEEYFDKIRDIFLWDAYQKSGYRTFGTFDSTTGTAFHFLKKGWKNPPFDYYNRCVPLLMENKTKVSKSDNCAGDTSEAALLQDYSLQLMTKFNNTKNKPYFAYNFFTYLSHDDQNNASRGDNMYLEFFQEISRRKVLNNTLMIFFSDHGLRFGDFRETYNGRVEGVSPFMFFVFPPWFEKKYPKDISNFNINQNRLTSFYDVHATIKDLLDFKGKKGKYPRTPGTSLFQEIPIGRTCSDANIPAAFCTCTRMSSAKVPRGLSDHLAKQVLDMINERTNNNTDICVRLTLNKTQSVHQLATESSSKYDTLYHVTVETTPGNGVFEAMINYKMSSRVATLVGDIIRLNLYRGQDTCVHTLALKPYCYCNDTSTILEREMIKH